MDKSVDGDKIGSEVLRKAFYIWSSESDSLWHKNEKGKDEWRYVTEEKFTQEILQKFGHFTQMIWQKTLYIGAGYAKMPDGKIIVVCNYSPAGNIFGDRPSDGQPPK